MSDSTAPSSTGHFKLGVFVIVGALLLVVVVLLLGGASVFERSVRAQTVLTESVNGLDVGAPVKYRGVTIGKISDITVAGAIYPSGSDSVNPANDAGAIVVDMSIGSNNFPGLTSAQIKTLFIRLAGEGLRARLTTTGFSGEAFLELDFLDPKAYPPLQIGFKPSELYIPSAPSTLGQVMDAASQLADELKKVNLSRVVGHIDDMATQAASTMSEIRQIVSANKGNLNRTLSELPDTAVKMHATVARADEILHDPRVNKALDSVSGLGTSASTTLADVRRLANELSELVAGERGDVQSIMADLRRTMADAASLIEEAKANPSWVLFGEPPPRDTAK
jgi:ABC-type transporter Mla subunit MlaD